MTARTLGGLVVALLFVAPLFIGLRGTDLRSDEAIYSYAVDRMLATGDWLTPRSIRVDGPFLEKPPLKFWMIAGPIRAGVLPQNELGYRVIDVLMASIAFLYIYLFGLRLGGPIAGVVAAFATFSMQSLVLAHGIRSNNMEAALVLTYCGGLYHFARSIDDGRRRTPHIFAVSAYFVLGFMTKFVAALFLPMIGALAVLTIPVVRAPFRHAWRQWMAAAAFAAALIAPWFVYETVKFGAAFWRVILGEHIYTRFTASLDPTHLQPWYYYFSRRWIDLMFGFTRAADAIAVLVLLGGGWRGRPWEVRLLLYWWLLPFVAMSLGTSKLFHYAYPFMPPLALALGWLVAGVASRLSDEWAPTIARTLQTQTRVREQRTRILLTAIGVAALALAAATALTGPIVWRVGGVKVFQNSSIVRPFIVAAMTLGLARADVLSVRVLIAVIALLFLPVTEYRLAWTRLNTVDHGRRSVAECAVQMRDSASELGVTVYDASPAKADHADYYYLSRVGRWTEARPGEDPDLDGHLLNANNLPIVRIATDDYLAWKTRTNAARLPAAVAIDNTVVVLPDRYAACVSSAVAAGAKAVS